MLTNKNKVVWYSIELRERKGERREEGKKKKEKQKEGRNEKKSRECEREIKGQEQYRANVGGSPQEDMIHLF